MWHQQQKEINEAKKMEALQKELAEERRAEDLKRLQEQAGLIKFVLKTFRFFLSIQNTHSHSFTLPENKRIV